MPCQKKVKYPTILKTRCQGITIRYYQKDRPRGTAGTLKDLEKFLDKEPFLVINSNLFVGHVDLAKFIEGHMETGSMITVGVYKDNGRNGIVENVTITVDKTVKSLHTIHSSILLRQTEGHHGGLPACIS